jgi:hypothetical protein
MNMAEENKATPLRRQIELFVKYIDRDPVLPQQIARYLDPLKDSLIGGDGSEYFLEQALNAAMKRWNDKRDYFQVSSIDGLSYYQNGSRVTKDQDLLLIDLHEMASTVGNALEWHALEYTRRNTSMRYRQDAVPQVTALHGSIDDENSRRNVRSIPTFQRDEITPFNVQLETLIEIYNNNPTFRLYGHSELQLLERLQSGDETVSIDKAEGFLRRAINSAFAMTDPNVNYHQITRKFDRSGFFYRIDMANMWDSYEGPSGGGFSTLLGTAIKKPEGLHWQALEWFKRNDFASYRSAMSGCPREEFKDSSPDVSNYRYNPEAARQMKTNRFPYL